MLHECLKLSVAKKIHLIDRELKSAQSITQLLHFPLLQMFNFQFGPKYSQLYQQSSNTMSYAINQLRSQHEAFSSTAPYAYQE